MNGKFILVKMNKLNESLHPSEAETDSEFLLDEAESDPSDWLKVFNREHLDQMSALVSLTA